MREVSYAVRVLRLLGCDTLIVTNAAGCVNLDWKAGDLMLIADHIKFFMESPCGVRTCPSSACASPTPPTSTPRPAGDGPPDRQGSWASSCGRASTCTSPAPSTRLRRRCGPPGCWAPTQRACPPRRRSSPPATVACGCWALPSLSNMGAGILDQPLSEQEVLDAAAACQDKFSRLVLACLKKID